MPLRTWTQVVSHRLLTLALLGLLFIGAAPASAYQEIPTATVTAVRLSVRTGPGVSYTVVTRLNQGETVTLLGRNLSASWVKVLLPSALEGWVNASYLTASLPLADLPVATTPDSLSTASGTVSVLQLELRAGPSISDRLVAILSQGHSLTLLGRTADTGWIKVQAGAAGEGWVEAQIWVRLPGDETETSAPTLQTATALTRLPIVNAPGVPSTPDGPRVTLSVSVVRPGSPIDVTVEGFPAGRDIAAVLTSRQVPLGFVIATGKTDATGQARLAFRLPDAWPNGVAITETALSLAVGTTDGVVLIWNGLTYRP